MRVYTESKPPYVKRERPLANHLVLRSVVRRRTLRLLLRHPPLLLILYFLDSTVSYRYNYPKTRSISALVYGLNKYITVEKIVSRKTLAS